MKTKWLACLAIVLGACPSVTVDENEGTLGPTVEFDPANKIIPFPNNLLLDPATGKIALPETCNESASTAATRLGALNKLDGFGTYETVINVTFTEPVDPASLDGRVLLFERVNAGEAADPLTAIPIPLAVIPGKTRRFTNQTDIKACTDPVMVDQVTFVATVPLQQRSTYTVALLAGVRTTAGNEFNPSFTWSLIREPQPVVVLDEEGNVTVNRTPLDPDKAEDKASLEGIALLWNAHQSAVSFLAGTGHDSSELLLAFEFNTQTIADPLDPALEGSVAAAPTVAPLVGLQSLSALAAPGGGGLRSGVFAQCDVDNPLDPDPDPVISNTQCLLRILLGSGNYQNGKTACVSAGCAAVTDVLAGGLLSKQYQTDVTNTLYVGTGSRPIPGAWNDPISPTVVHDTNLGGAPDPLSIAETLVLLPRGAVPGTGFKTVIFQHGITRAKTDVLGVMGALAGSGFAVVAIDAPNHGTRAVRISNAANAIPALDCSDVLVGIPAKRPDNGPDPTSHASCYAPPFSADLAGTRDAFRQSVLDLQQLVVSLKTCGTTLCGKVKVDAARLGYVGTSMIGGNLGGIALGTIPDIDAGVLNVSGAGWLDILENTEQVVAFQCPLVDALIDAGALTCGSAPCTAADKFDPIAGTGLCLTPAWKTDPGYIQFSVIGRWVLDPADPANFNTRLAGSKFLLQRVDKDDVVPNVATDREGALVAQLKGDASCNLPNPSPPPAFIPSTALLAAPTSSHFLDYVTIPPLTPGCGLGNKFTHGSMLAPVGRCAAPAAATFCDLRALQGNNGCPNNELCLSATDGNLGTARLQTDMAFFLISNVLP